MNLVTADGRLVKASNSENSDLFWGLRGGGGNFGILTNIEYKLYPVGPEVVGGLVACGLVKKENVLELYRTLGRKCHLVDRSYCLSRTTRTMASKRCGTGNDLLPYLPAIQVNLNRR